MKSCFYRVNYYRLAAVYVLYFFILDMYFRPLREYAVGCGETISIAILAFGFCKNYFLKMILLTTCYYFSTEIPFKNREEQYYLIRLGRERICLRNILYVGWSSILLSTGLFLLSILDTFSCQQFENQWTPLDKTIALTDLPQQIGMMFGIPYEAIEAYSPYRLILLVFFFTLLCFFFVGVFMYALNLIFHRTIAMILCISVVLMPDVIVRANMIPVYYSPISWLSCDCWRYGNVVSKPDTSFIVCAYIFLIISLSFVCLAKVKRTTYE